jgi:hypothetical protein
MYVCVMPFFFVVTLMAVCVPSRRASRLYPAVDLRCE